MGRGSHQAAVMLIAKTPGGTEDQQGIPFVGKFIRRAILRDPSKYETVKKDFGEIVKKEAAMRGTER